MKHIRTKDGKIGKITHEDNKNYRAKIGRKCPLINKENVINKADTIGELCDEYVCVNEDETPFLLSVYEETNGEKYAYRFGFPKEHSLNDYLKEYNIFGAIWTDKGLQFVAQMKGILPDGSIDWELL